MREIGRERREIKREKVVVDEGCETGTNLQESLTLHSCIHTAVHNSGAGVERAARAWNVEGREAEQPFLAVGRLFSL